MMAESGFCLPWTFAEFEIFKLQVYNTTFKHMRMIEAELSPFLQSIAYGTVGIVPEDPLPLNQIIRASLGELRLRVVAVLNDQGRHRKDWGLINSWTSPYFKTLRPLRLDLTHSEAMGQLTEYHQVSATVTIGPRQRLLDIGLYSLGPNLPGEARTVMITARTIAQSRGFLVLTRRDNPLTEDTYGRLFTMKRIFSNRPRKTFAPKFIRFATFSDEHDFGELVSCFEQTEPVLPVLPSGNQTTKFLKRLERRDFNLKSVF